MTWQQLDDWLQQEIALLDAQPFGRFLTAEFFDQEEPRARSRVDAFVWARYVEERDPVLDEELRRWVMFRLVWACHWIGPLSHGTMSARAVERTEWLTLLLLDSWPDFGREHIRDRLADASE